MVLIVEDGTGRLDADALVSVADVDLYHGQIGTADWIGDETVKEQAIRRASRWISETFPWRGTRVKGRDQRFAWPRYSVVDAEGYSVAANVIPREVREAVAEAAVRELVDPGSLSPDFVPGEKIVSASVGPIRATFDEGSSGADSVKPVLTIVREILSPLLGRQSSSLSGGSTRV